jgi:hypothetical protein
MRGAHARIPKVSRISASGRHSTEVGGYFGQHHVNVKHVIELHARGFGIGPTRSIESRFDTNMGGHTNGG